MRINYSFHAFLFIKTVTYWSRFTIDGLFMVYLRILYLNPNIKFITYVIEKFYDEDEPPLKGLRLSVPQTDTPCPWSRRRVSETYYSASVWVVVRLRNGRDIRTGGTPRRIRQDQQYHFTVFHPSDDYCPEIKSGSTSDPSGSRSVFV